jgi:hypothetical protein
MLNAQCTTDVQAAVAAEEARLAMVQGAASAAIGQGAGNIIGGASVAIEEGGLDGPRQLHEGDRPGRHGTGHFRDAMFTYGMYVPLTVAAFTNENLRKWQLSPPTLEKVP